MWTVVFCDEFDDEFSNNFDQNLQNTILAKARALEKGGPTIGRPYVDTLNDSRHPNMKELRFDHADGTWRLAFVFDPDRNAVVLVAGDKSGVSQKRFYKQLIRKADQRYDNHLASLKRK
ncbi:type II toxin-antitoxin system RelE/ParE family toxin [Thalassospira mesophila]|uniref:Toxin-antitoxin system, toxin component, RelE family protein n=1 Tax=Thalassospira mesophila TaxID=1293891 RepID=A0A1Y2KXB3_9PROT|nr:type II toxin-antitoxin system RelE/ParE family toxin [Thalassospira mesophila]OSQ36987.1 toxin-antitoxin system, toxin component, RelE family protein [Thalassospira mesophila]